MTTFAYKETHRLGTLREHFLEWEHAKIIFFGILPLIILIPIFGLLGMQVALYATSLFVLGQLIPLPGSNGIHLAFSSRPFYVFILALYFSLLALLSVMNLFIIILLSLTFAVLVLIFYYYNFEPH